MNFKGISVAGLGGLALGVVILAIIVSMGGEILAQLQSQQTANSIAYNVTGKGLTGMQTFGNWIPIVVIVVVAAAIIGLLIAYLGGAGKSV